MEVLTKKVPASTMNTPNIGRLGGWCEWRHVGRKRRFVQLSRKSGRIEHRVSHICLYAVDPPNFKPMEGRKKRRHPLEINRLAAKRAYLPPTDPSLHCTKGSTHGCPIRGKRNIVRRVIRDPNTLT